MTRWRLTIEYDGGPFMGWQRQDHGPSVQQKLEEALRKMTGEQAAFHAAGRTDAGVHALAMSAHVDVMKSLTPHRLREGLNALVRPHPISVLEVGQVADDELAGDRLGVAVHQIVEDHDLVPGVHQCPDRVSADVAGPARHQ